MERKRKSGRMAGGGMAVVASALTLWACPIAAGDVLMEQDYDTRLSVISYWHPGSGVQLGDDFQPERPTMITSVTFSMIASWPVVPYDWSFAVHRSTDEHPSRGFGPEYDWFHFQTGPSSVIDQGAWKHREGTHLFEVTFDDVNLLLDPADTVEGTFWFSPGGWTQNTNETKSWWLTAGNGVVNGNETWGKSYPYYEWPGWIPLSSYGAPASDYAMRIEGYAIPAPGIPVAFGLGSLGLLAGRSRRRKG